MTVLQRDHACGPIADNVASRQNISIQRRELTELVLHFPPYSSRITFRELRKLIQQAKLIKSPQTLLVLLYSQGGKLARESHELLVERAEEVKRQLVALGVRPSSIQLVDDGHHQSPSADCRIAHVTTVVLVQSLT
jgi:transcription initiation factor TFIID subunit TAF12